MEMSSLISALLLLHLGISEVTIFAAECGIPQWTGRIVGGKNAQPGSWPWQVSLWARNQHICGGTLINNKWVVTAAHCFIENSLTAESITVYLGSYKLTEKDPEEISVGVAKIINYPTYRRESDSGDISLVELSSRVNFTKHIWPICLPASGVIFPTGLQCWVTGWGQIKGGLNQSLVEILQEVAVPLIDSEKCNQLYNTKNPQGAFTARIKNDMICAGYIKGGKASCQGDSGGPVVCQEGKRWYLAGVVSFGAGCALLYRPGVNTLVTAYMDWIKSKTDMKQFPAGDLEGLQQVGRGGFGTVYRGWSRSLNMEVALKTFQRAQSFSINKLMKDILKEREVMEKASNPFVILLLGMYERQEGEVSEHGLVMEYVPNGSLRSLFDTMDVPWALRFQMLHQVALGMNYLHTLDPPIIHRDLKPSNVLLNKHFDVKITDFGLSKIAGATTSATPYFAGTPSYMAPEALTDLNYKPTMAFDVYSFGIMIWAVLSGEEPFPNAHPALIQLHIPNGQRPSLEVLDHLSHIKMVPEAKELMIKCWSGNADARPSFLECSHATKLMFELYSSEIKGAIRTMEDHTHQLQNETLEDPGYDSTCQDSSLNQVIAAIKGDSQETRQDEQPQAVAIFNETTEIFQEEPSDKGKTLSNAIEAIKESQDYKHIIDCATDIGKTVEKGGQQVGKFYNDNRGEVQKVAELWKPIRKFFK